MFGPEKYQSDIAPVLKFSSFPKNAKKLLIVNNGLTRLKLDTTNWGSGFNLNLLCFMTADAEGQTQCRHFRSIGG